MEKVARQSLASQVAERIRSLITSGTYSVGARLPTEPELMALLGVGRSSVREAIRALAHAGILEVRQGSGTFVCAPPEDASTLTHHLRNAQDVELHEARTAIEGVLARLAAQRRTDAHLQTLQHTLAERDRIAQHAPPDVAAFVDADLCFHRTIAQASGNALLAELYELLTASLRPSLHSQLEAFGITAESTRLHHELYTALVCADPQRAQQVAEALIAENLTATSSN
ncbi:MAG: FadR family transcriptional regulator [Chloroflexaceae bacterium]|nr:FadR family transcriptional regulator [Chloroflexaceae bacterium]